MKAKYLTSVEGNEVIKTNIENIKASSEKTKKLFADLNQQATEAQKEDHEIHNKGWEGIKTNLHEQGLITSEEKEFGIFAINDHNQIFLEGMHKPPTKNSEPTETASTEV